jgi:hypothetical protein
MENIPTSLGEGEMVKNSPAFDKKKAAKIESGLVRSIHFPMEKKRIGRSLLKMAEEDPNTAVAILLKNLNNENGKIAEFVHVLLVKSTRSKKGMRAVIENIINPDKVIHCNAVAYLSSKKGFHAITYASFYEQTYLLIVIARNKEIPVVDIEALVDVTKDTYLEGETIQAIQDIAACLDFIKHRHRTADTLKGYLTDMLRMAPDLTRMGAYDGQIAEPLKRAIKASKKRAVDETKEIIEVRALESFVRKDLNRMGRLVKGSFSERPHLDLDQISGTDAFAIMKMGRLIDAVTLKAVSGKREEGLKILASYLSTEYRHYLDESKPRIERKDGRVLTSIYTIGLTLLKLASYLMSQTAEDIYQRYFRGFEPEPSVHVLPWPEPIMKFMT